MKLIGIDYGRRRIGIAVTDETATCVRGHSTIDTKQIPDPISKIIEIIKKEAADAIVIGLPLTYDDNETPMTSEIRKFADKLRPQTDKPIYFADEHLSSVKAAQLLQFQKKKVRRNKTTTDRYAACIILESFLDEYRKDNSI